jgi:periplasmic protein CpxP/Spy
MAPATEKGLQMSYSITASLARSVAVAALLSAPLAVAPLTAHAQSPAPTHPTAPSAANPANAPAGMQGETVEQRIKQLHSELKITPDQESKWNSVAQAMRDNAAGMEKLVAEKREKGAANMTAVDDLKTYQEFTQQHLDGLKNLTSAFSTLYDSMNDQQKKNADEVFAKFNRAEPHAGTPNRNG